MQKTFFIVILFLITLLSSSCNIEDKYAPINEYANIDLSQVPFTNLSDYGFFAGDMNALNPVQGVYSYSLTSPLFSDYSSKERFIYLPEETTMEYEGDFNVLNFPIGTIIIKNFMYYNDIRDKSLGRKMIETRLLVRKETKWKPFSYKWNDEQTEATRLIVGGTLSASTIIENGNLKEISRYVIPRELDCRTCHNLNEDMLPIGPKPANLNRLMADDLSLNQIENFVEQGVLSGTPANISQVPDYRDTSLDPIIRGKAYLDANCAFCHRQGGTANANGLFINWDYEGEEIHTGIFKIPTNYNAPQLQYDIVPGSPDESILLYRMTQTQAPDVMPQIGRSINDDEGIEIIREYIYNIE
jgi:uncharacterized repeat protein (TIGR03806 family)